MNSTKVEKYQNFMLESNRIEGEDRLNPGDLKAVRFVVSVIDMKKPEILHIHSLLGEYLKKHWVGKYRDVDVYVGGRKGSSPYLLDETMGNFIQSLPQLSSWEAHNEFEKIHPFQDLNGRVGRLIWLHKALDEGYDFKIPFLQAYYYQTLQRS
jgi:Fic family protein